MAEYFAGKVALFTGGGNWIGAATCRAFGRRARVAVSRSRCGGGPREWPPISRAKNGAANATRLAVDVADRASFTSLSPARAIADAAGGIDIAVNGAGTTVAQ